MKTKHWSTRTLIVFTGDWAENKQNSAHLDFMNNLDLSEQLGRVTKLLTGNPNTQQLCRDFFSSVVCEQPEMKKREKQSHRTIKKSAQREREAEL